MPCTRYIFFFHAWCQVGSKAQQKTIKEARHRNVVVAVVVLVLVHVLVLVIVVFVIVIVVFTLQRTW